ncbi:MAG: cytochrome c oxidase assembly protein [Phenylobacterium sp.]|uniref:cytochrome c oxidase assembly protein n=1 Tax=Phenylobacterium sp. TaxID=1871053 RepID=UPI003919850A
MSRQDALGAAAQAIWTPYCGVAPGPGEILVRWNLDPWLLAVAAAAVACWIWARRRVALDGRLIGLAALALAIGFVSPLCALSSALFSARVVHHALLVAVAAPLLAFGLPASGRGPSLAGAAGLHAAVFWLWHAPAPYAWALGHDGVYWLMQASLLGTALLMWRAVRRCCGLAAAAALLATMVQMGLLGALITFAPAPLYAPHLTTTWAWGLSPLADQQLAGLIMWAPMALAYLLAALAIVGRSLSSPRAEAA